MNNLTVVIDLSTITDNAFWSNATDSGGDIRATDSTNTQLLSVHLANFSKAHKKGVLYVKSNGNGLRLWSGTGLLSQPAQTEAFGSALAFLGETSATDPYSFFDFAGLLGARLESQAMSRLDFGDFSGNSVKLTGTGSATFTQSDDFLTNQTVATKPDDDAESLFADTSNISGTDGTQATYEVWYKITAGHFPVPFSIGNLVTDPADTVGTYNAGLVFFQAGLDGSAIQLLQFREVHLDEEEDPTIDTAVLCSAAITPESEGVYHHLVFSVDLNSLATALVVHDGSQISLDDNSGSVKHLTALPLSPTSILGTRTLSFEPESTPGNLGGGAGSVGFFGHYRGLRDLAWAQARYAMRHVGPNVVDFASTAWPN